MNEQQLREIIARIMAMVASARANVGALQATIDGIMSNTERLIPEARRSDAAVALTEARSRIMATLVSLDLSLLDPSITGERQDALAVQRAMSEAQVNEYESKHASGVLA